MFSTDEIKAMLQSGQKAEDIANSFADSLNAAIAAEEKERQAKAAKSQKVKDAQVAIDYLFDFFDEYYPEMGTSETDIDGEEFVELMDELAPQIVKLSKLCDALGDLSTTKESKIIKSDPITDFLKDFNLL